MISNSIANWKNKLEKSAFMNDCVSVETVECPVHRTEFSMYDDGIGINFLDKGKKRTSEIAMTAKEMRKLAIKMLCAAESWEKNNS